MNYPQEPDEEEPDDEQTQGEDVPDSMANIFPDGFITDGLMYYGDYQFSSETLGDFEVDTSIDNRIIHSLLGPLVWNYDSSSEIVTLQSEWWGSLYTHVPGTSADKTAASGLGLQWPYVKSEITGAVYYVNVSSDPDDSESTPFYNHRQVDGQDIGWQHSIGIDLSSASNYYTAAETIVGQMQSLLSRDGGDPK